MGQCSGYLLSSFLWSIMINRRYVISSLFQGTKKFKTFFYDKVRWISHADFFFGVSQPYFYLTFANIIYLHQKFLPAQRLLANFQNKRKRSKTRANSGWVHLAALWIHEAFSPNKLPTLLSLLRIPIFCHFGSTSFVLPIRPKDSILNRDRRVDGTVTRIV